MAGFEYKCEKCNKTFESPSIDNISRKVKKHAKKEHKIEIPRSEIQKKIRKTTNQL